MAQLEIFAGIVGIGVLLAVFVPLTFDPAEFPDVGGNVTKALCNLDIFFLGNSTLLACDQPDDTFNIVAGTGIILDANSTTKTLIINSTGGGTVIGTQVCPAGEFFDAFFGGNSTFRCTPESAGGADVFMNNTGIGVELFKNKTNDTFFIKTLVGVGGITITNSTDEVFINGTSLDEIFTNLGGGSQVFKNETGTEVFFRTLVNGSGIAIQQDDEEITIRNTGIIDIVNVGNGSKVLQNVTGNTAHLRSLLNTTGIDIEENGQVITFAVNNEFFNNATQFDNFEWARAGDFDTFSSNTPKFKKDVFTVYRVNVLEYADKTGDRATWTSALPTPFPENATVSLDIYWYIEVDSSPDDGVCWDIGIKGIADGTTLDITPPTMDVVCRTGLATTPVDELMIDNITFTQSQHGLVGKDFVVIFLERDTANVLDDWSDVANFLGIRIIWDTITE